jgi:hypothetical protein
MPTKRHLIWMMIQQVSSAGKVPAGEMQMPEKSKYGRQLGRFSAELLGTLRFRGYLGYVRLQRTGR